MYAERVTATFWPGVELCRGINLGLSLSLYLAAVAVLLLILDRTVTRACVRELALAMLCYSVFKR